MDLNQVTMPALDVKASIAFYRRMGFEPVVLAPHYARFKATTGESTFSIHAMESLSEPSPTVVYFECKDLQSEVDRLKLAGFEFYSDVTPEPWLWTEARLRDPSGNILCLYHAGENRLNPPWRYQPTE